MIDTYRARQPFVRHIRPRNHVAFMPLDPLNLGPLIDAQNRFRRDFVAFAAVWQDAKDNWKDDRARRFEQEHLSTLGPSLTRFAAALNEFTEQIRQAQSALSDRTQSSDQLY